MKTATRILPGRASRRTSRPRLSRSDAPRTAGVAGLKFTKSLCLGPIAPLNRILVPVDFSVCSRRALRCALSLARRTKATLGLLYVAESNPAGSELGATPLPQLESDLRQMARKQLARLRRQDVPATVPSQAIIRAGRPEVEILNVANTFKADLIVMAVHGNDSQQGQLGTTAGRVAGSATCPVLLVPVPELCTPFFI